MARSCGIRIGPRRYELVVLDGSAKKHKIVAYRAGEFPTDAASHEAAVAATLKEVAKENKIPRENVGLVIDTGAAAFRRLTLPFVDRAKIEQVIKYEVEAQLPQWNVDDVVVDSIPLADDGERTELLVSAVPKEHLRRVLASCEKAGIEPIEAELETTAMVNAAAAADIFHIDDAQLLVHVGEYSTSVVVVDAGEVREMRVIHIGALSHDVTPTADAMDGDDPEAETGSGEAAIEPDPMEALRRIDQTVKRIRRELGRTISGSRTINPIDAIYVCGIEMPSLIGSSALDVPIYVLDCFDEDSGQPADGYGELVVAYGSAIRALGGGTLRPSLRREDLRYTGTFERVEFPLAVACLLLCTFLGVINIFQFRENKRLQQGVAFWLVSSNNYMVGEPRENKLGTLRPVPEDLKNYAAIFKDGQRDGNRTYVQSLQYIEGKLKEKVQALQRELGRSTDISQPQSAFVAANLVLGVLEKEEKKWRPSLRKLEAQYEQSRAGQPDTVRVTLDITFFADSAVVATQNYESFTRALQEQPWFVGIERKKTESLENGRGIHTSGVPITVDVSKYLEAQS